MNTLEELRASLASHAEELTDQGVPTRAGAIATRVRRVRRQRRAAVAGGLVAVLVIAAFGAGLGSLSQRRSLEPTTPLAGHAISRTVEVDGFTYDLATTAESRPGDSTLTLMLPKADRDRVVSLVASGLGTGEATLFAGNGRPDNLSSPGQPAAYDGDSVLDRVATASAVDVPVGVVPQRTRLTVRLRNAGAGAVVGLAVYDQGTPLPGGVSADGMAFPKTVGEERLVAASIGRQGHRSVSITFRGPVRHPDLRQLCATARKHVWGEVTDSASKGWSGGGCAPMDPIEDVNLGVGASAGVPSGGFGPGMHTITLAAFDHVAHRKDTPVDPSDVRVAIGLYDDPSPVRRVAGMTWDTRLLSGGRMWHLDQVLPYRERAVTVDATSGPVMLGAVFAGRSNSCVVATGSDRTVFQMPCTGSAAGGPLGTWGQVLMPGATYRLSTADPDDNRKPGTGLRYVLIYRPAA